MMFRFLRSRAGLMLFMTRHLMAVVHRSVPRIMEEERALVEQQHRLEQEVDHGELKKVLRDFKAQTSRSAKIAHELYEQEQNVFLAETRTFEELEHVDEGFRRLNEKAKELPESEAKRRLQEQLAKLQRHIERVEDEMQEKFSKEYQEVLDEEGASAEERLVSVNNIMEIMNEAWRKRTDEEQRHHEEEVVEQEEEHLLTLFKRLDVSEIAQAEAHLAQEVEHFLHMYEQTWEAYRLMLLAFTQILYYIKRNQHFYEEYRERLKREGFPDLDEVDEALTKMEESEERDAHRLADSIRKGPLTP